ncbi:flagellar FlbD family protein [Alkalihalobacillus hwajinpoensis]|uniref:flagellar FlbD family protein n=1 Tax=Guptibacillus hwajinpoensis TaxID=208199 RepID=UPI0018846407|nr:flagellar FlbD family protein [Pseudalkalibacillus hwajinpoensis]MBF0705166.1 flagellar FlbD family protein [Pseudalkalibacillus hwajinpoensis]
MIPVTKLNRETMMLNAIYIETIESTPDTMILLTNGKRYVVLETIEQVKQLVTEFYRDISVLEKK